MENEHEALARLISAEQDERRRLALFLHDGPVQQLSGIALMLDGALHELAGAGEGRAHAIIDAAVAQLRATIRELRELSFALEPVVLRDHGFGPAVRALADQAAGSYGIAFDLDTGEADAIGATASIALYTIIRELLEQAIRRGPPRTVRIRVCATADGGLVASFADDAASERRMRSLEAIEERARQLHGTLEVHPAEGGTDIRVTLPAHTARR
jgi:two-component system NarL family sensor kinase